MAASINPHDFPHIIEAIARYSDWPTLLTLRLVSLSMQRLVDPLLSEDLLELSTDSSGELTVSTWIPWRYDHALCIPYFHPSGNEFVQRAVLTRAERVRVICERSTARLNDLLQWVNPRAEVTLLHSPSAVFDIDIHIPPCAELVVEAVIDPHCACQDESRGKLTHEARSVMMYFISGGGRKQSGLPRCAVIDGAVNLGVQSLQLIAQFGQPRPVLCGDTDIDTNPKLEVLVRLPWHQSNKTLQRQIAERFHIPDSQVSFW